MSRFKIDMKMDIVIMQDTNIHWKVFEKIDASKISKQRLYKGLFVDFSRYEIFFSPSLKFILQIKACLKITKK